MLIEKASKLDHHKETNSVIDLNDLISHLKLKFFRFSCSGRYRGAFSVWAYQALALRKVLHILHYYIVPNSTESELRQTLNYLTCQSTGISDVWVWISGYESKYSRLQYIQDEVDDCPLLWSILDESTYENIAHIAVHRNNLALTKALCEIRDCYQINQRNTDEETPCHIAVREWKLDHLTVLIQHPLVDISLCNLQGRSVVVCLLYICLQKLRKEESLSYSHIGHLLSQMLTSSTSCLDIDTAGLDALDYAILIGSPVLINILLTASLTRGVTEYSKYLRRAILTNRPSVVDLIACEHLRSDQMMSLTNHTLYLSDLSKTLHYAIMHSKTRALATLLSRPAFLSALSSPAADYFDRNWLSWPLHAAIERYKYHADSESLRILLMFGANPVLRTFCRGTLEDERKGRLVDRNQWVDTDYSDISVHDSVFSYATSLTLIASSSASLVEIESRAVDVVRLLLIDIKSAVCHIPNSARHIQADEAPVDCPQASCSISQSDSICEEVVRRSAGPLDFFFSYSLFSCNPLVTVVMSCTSSHATRPSWQVYHGRRSMETGSQNGLCLLEHLLIHSPFVALLNLQEEPTALTPLAAACCRGNIPLINILLQHGAEPSMKLNTELTRPTHSLAMSLRAAVDNLEASMNQACREYGFLSGVVVVNAYERVVGYLIDIRKDAELARSSIAAIDTNTLKQLIDATTSNESVKSMGTLNDYTASHGKSHKPLLHLPVDKRRVISCFLNGIELLILPNATDSKPYAGVRSGSLSYSKRALDVVDILCDESSLSDERTLLNHNTLEQLRSMVSLYTRSFSHRVYANKSVDIVSDTISCLVKWGKSVLRLHECRRKLLGVMELESGIMCLSVRRKRKEVVRCLKAFMSRSRVHTAYNHIVQNTPVYPAFYVTERDSVGIYECLRNHEKQRSHERTLAELAQVEILGDHQPLRDCGVRIRSISRSDRMWWWDAVEAKDWSLVTHLLQDICDNENGAALEQFVVTLLKNRAPSHLVLDIIRNGARFGRTTEHLEHAVRNSEPVVFLSIILAGTFHIDSSFWQRLFELFKSTWEPFAHQANRSICTSALFQGACAVGSQGRDYDIDAYSFDMRRSALLEILSAGRNSCEYMKTELTKFPGLLCCGECVFSRIDSVSVEDIVSRIDRSTLHTTDNEDDGTSSDMNSTSTEEFHSSAVYQGCEFLRTSYIGDLPIVVGEPPPRPLSEWSSYPLLGVLGVHKGIVSLPVVPTLSIYGKQSANWTVQKFSEQFLEFFSVEDRFLCHPPLLGGEQLSPKLSDSSIYIFLNRDASQGLIKALVHNGSQVTAEILTHALSLVSSDPSRVMLADSILEGHMRHMNLSEFCASNGCTDFLRELLRFSYNCPPGTDRDQDAEVQRYQYYRYVTPFRLEVDALRMLDEMEHPLLRHVAQCREKQEALVEGVRGMIFSYVRDLENLELEQHIPSVYRVINGILKFCRTSMQLLTYELSYNQLRQVASSYTVASDDSKTYQLNMEEIFVSLGVSDESSFVKLLTDIVSAPVVQAERIAVRLKEYTIACESITSKSFVDFNPKYVHSWLDWVNSLCVFLGESGRDVVRVCEVMRSMCLLGEGKCDNRILEWMREPSSEYDAGDNEWLHHSDTDTWVNSVDYILHERAFAEENYAKLRSTRVLVNTNIRSLQSYSEYNIDTWELGVRFREGKWLNVICLPLLCLEPNDILDVVVWNRQDKCDHDSIHLLENQMFTSKTLFHVLCTLLHISASSLQDMSSQELLIRLVVFAETVVHHVENGYESLSIENQLRDTLLVQCEEALKSRISSLEDMFSAAMTVTKSDHSAGPVHGNGRIMHRKLNYRFRLCRSIRVNKHLLVYIQGCRRHICQPHISNSSMVSGTSTAKSSYNHNIYDLWNIVKSAISSRLPACVEVATEFVKQKFHDGSFGTITVSSKFNILPLSIWREVCAVGVLDILDMLLDFIDIVKQYDNVVISEKSVSHAASSADDNISRYQERPSWSLIHCVLTGCGDASVAVERLAENFSYIGMQHQQCQNTCVLDGALRSSLRCVGGYSLSTELSGSRGRERQNICKRLLQSRPLCEFALQPLDANSVPEMDTTDDYPYSALDMLAMRSMWDCVLTSLSTYSQPYAISSQSFYSSWRMNRNCFSALLHCAVIDKQNFVFDFLLRELIEIKKVREKTEYINALSALGWMLASSRTYFDTTGSKHRHYLLTDAIYSSNRDIIHRVIWMADNIWSEIDELKDARGPVEVKFIMGIPVEDKPSILNKPAGQDSDEPSLPALRSIVDAAIEVDDSYLLKYLLHAVDIIHCVISSFSLVRTALHCGAVNCLFLVLRNTWSQHAGNIDSPGYVRLIGDAVIDGRNDKISAALLHAVLISRNNSFYDTIDANAFDQCLLGWKYLYYRVDGECSVQGVSVDVTQFFNAETVLGLQRKCLAKSKPISCCILMQYCSMMYSSVSDRTFIEEIKLHYLHMFERAAAVDGMSEVALASLRCLQKLQSPLPCLDKSMMANSTFFLALKFITQNRSLCSEPMGSYLLPDIDFYEGRINCDELRCILLEDSGISAEEAIQSALVPTVITESSSEDNIEIKNQAVQVVENENITHTSDLKGALNNMLPKRKRYVTIKARGKIKTFAV